MIEPRKRLIVEAGAVFGRGSQHLDACRHLRQGPTGVGEQGMDAWGLARSLGDPVISVKNCGLVEPLISTRPWGVVPAPLAGKV